MLVVGLVSTSTGEEAEAPSGVVSAASSPGSVTGAGGDPELMSRRGGVKDLTWSRSKKPTRRRSRGLNTVPVEEAGVMEESRTQHDLHRRSRHDGGVEVSARLGGEHISRSPATVRSLPIGDGSVESRPRRGGGGSQWRIDLDGPPMEGATHDAPAQVQRDQEEK
jgi:hypothetical protein